MRCYFVYILCLLFSQHIYALPEQCLLGSWQSNKDKTLEYNLPTWEWSAKYHKIKHKQQYYDMFGKMMATYADGVADISFE
ncbi:MAG: hypothetical protein IK065_00875 [Neisseriaceae bacterium]|nr:hypothetical protein [Neisseriaceae bacterium]